MAELAMLADLQQTVYPEEINRQLHVELVLSDAL